MTNINWLPPICVLTGDEIHNLDMCPVRELNPQPFLVYSPSSSQEPPCQGPDICYLSIVKHFDFFLCHHTILDYVGCADEWDNLHIRRKGGYSYFAMWSMMFDLTDYDSSVAAQKRSDKSCSKRLPPSLMSYCYYQVNVLIETHQFRQTVFFKTIYQ